MRYFVANSDSIEQIGLPTGTPTLSAWFIHLFLLELVITNPNDYVTELGGGGGLLGIHE